MTDRVQLLLIEDEPADAELFADALEDSGDTPWADLVHRRSLDEANRHAADHDVDCVILDLGLPGCTGLEALSRFRAAHPNIPVVVLTGNTSEAIAVQALVAGAQDYIPKHDLDPTVVRRSVRYSLERNRAIIDLTAAHTRLEQFASVVSHDLRSPLSVLLGYCDILREEDADLTTDERLLFLQKIDSAGRRLADMVADLLRYAVADALPLQRVDLDELVAEAVRHLLSPETHPAMRIDVAAQLPVVEGQPVALRHALLNLLANAVAYRSPDRDLIITISHVAVDGRCHLFVADNGVGIPASRRLEVFEPGSRLQTTSAAGTGLGLYAVRSLIERHGGRVSVDDNPSGNGARFCIDLPLPVHDVLRAPAHDRSETDASADDDPQDDPPAADLDGDVAAVAGVPAVAKILDVVCRTTGMGFAAVARVTTERWVACAVRDLIEFGLVPGGELDVRTTICAEVRASGQLIAFDHASADEVFSTHPTPKLYGFESYISVPINRSDGSFFGTLCAHDPRPARVNRPEVIGMFVLFADLIAAHLAGVGEAAELAAERA